MEFSLSSSNKFLHNSFLIKELVIKNFIIV